MRCREDAEHPVFITSPTVLSGTGRGGSAFRVRLVTDWASTAQSCIAAATAAGVLSISRTTHSRSSSLARSRSSRLPKVCRHQAPTPLWASLGEPGIGRRSLAEGKWGGPRPRGHLHLIAAGELHR